MLNYIFETTIVGIIFSIVGVIIFNLSINKNNNSNNIYGIYLAFFMTGVIIHILLELFNIAT